MAKTTPEPKPVPPDYIGVGVSLKERIFWGVLYGFLATIVFGAIIWRALDG